MQGSIILVGFMGTGKSAVGRRLARRLRRRFFDTDAWAVSEAGMPIAEIFSRFGEEAFRDLEAEAARVVSGSRDWIVSTGGGILGREENVRLLREAGPLVCLTARPEVILARTAPWETRPLLRDAADPLETIQRLLQARAADYAKADWSLDTSDLTPDEAVDSICARFSFPSASEAIR